MKRILLPVLFLSAVLLMAVQLTYTVGNSDSATDWPEYLGGPDRNHYSPLNQLDTGNVSQLKVAWEYHSGDSGQVQCNPIIVDGTLFGVTATNQIFALDAATGQQKWRYVEPGGKAFNTNRGVTYWKSTDYF